VRASSSRYGVSHPERYLKSEAAKWVAILKCIGLAGSM
jgi:hypothetical protein